MKKRKLLATGGIVASLILSGSTSQAFAKTSRPETFIEVTSDATNKEKNNSDSKIGMEEFGLDAEDVLDEAELQESSRDILFSEGFSPSQVHKILNAGKRQKER